jgi:hypothetical protein
MQEINISGFSMVMLVKNLEETIEFYKNLNFKHEVMGSNPEHHHVSRDGVTFILHPAIKIEDVRPSTSFLDNNKYYFDAFCYTNAVDLIADEFISKGIEIVRGPNYSKQFSEVTIKDINGYCIAFGGSVLRKEI